LERQGLIERQRGERDRVLSGQHALEIAVPNLVVLPWEAVVEFRNHAGSAEARAMLREFGQKAATEYLEDAEAFLGSIRYGVVDALFFAFERQRQGWPERIAAAQEQGVLQSRM